MQLTHFTDYALRVLIFVANRYGAPTTIREVSGAHQISEEHLMKVVHSLSKLGYITTVRGKGGGIKPARPPSEISVGSVIRDVESLGPVECFAPDYDRQRLLYSNAALRSVLESAQSSFLETLDTCTIADVMRQGLSCCAQIPQPDDTDSGAVHTAAHLPVKVRARHA